MASTGSKWRLDRPAEGFDAAVPPLALETAPMFRTFLPECYEPRYAYPLLVMFHAHGGNEDQVLDLVPRMSRRNFVALSLRGPELMGVREDGHLACGWGTDDRHVDTVNENIIKAVESVRRVCNIHTERIFLVGVCEGAAAAYRAAFAMGDRVAGVVSLNGGIPKVPPGDAPFDFATLKPMRFLIGHGIANAIVPCSVARQDYKQLYAAGADVRLRTYATTHRLHQDMLNDVNRWVIGALNADTDRMSQVR